MLIEERSKDNRKQAIKTSLKSLAGLLCLIVILLFVDNMILPIKVTDYFWNYGWIIIVYLFYSVYSNYKSFKEFLDDTDYIEMINENYRFPLAQFKAIVTSNEVFLSRIEKKVDIIKFFSPVPFLIYGIGVYVDEKAILDKTIKIFNYIIIYKDIMMYGGFISFSIYLIWLYRLFEKHKQLSLRTVRFQSELYFYEELLLSDEKSRRKDYKDTIKRMLY